MAKDAFFAYLAEHLESINECVLGHAPAPLDPTDQIDDLKRYLYEPVARFVRAGGKRIRPALCLLGAEAVGAPEDVAYPVAAAVELFQAAALIHDDIADKSELRRGEPCLHISEGTGIAINAGDAALVATTTSILCEEGYDAEQRIRLLDELMTMEERTLEGQALDLGWVRDGRWDIAASDYLAMARRKTAYYSAAMPLVLGAICGNGTKAQVEGLRSFGMQCGLAFQIQDDLLNLVGDAERQGKDFRSDITEGKRTLVMVWALTHLGEEERSELVGILSSGTTEPEQLARAVELAEKGGGIDYARKHALELADDAKGELGELDIAEHASGVLRSMADYFVRRAS